ncbi:DsbA family protein [Roseomonas sp. NAR14]|uniref:DsbA family protein n=1 Tax=Roseomonas acroporae TaxID=2937791 RepID=A0A9X1Y8P9_9PROT|nr:thioredoxin domain-containing protein [Roseomonas acroporae]MCK8785979.1 DsbA family protein [Roseomonas acroporae]
MSDIPAAPRRGLILAAGALLAMPRIVRAQGGAAGGTAGGAAGNTTETPAPAAPAAAPEGDPRLTERGIGRLDAPMRVQEFMSLTCTHCAHFHKETLPKVRTELVQTGKVRLVWRDFPLDGLALAAAMTARALPAERYEAFIGTLFATQDRWAFTRRQDPLEELRKMAALAGMNAQQFDAVQADQALRRAVTASRVEGEQRYRVDATPSFVFGDRKESGDLSFERFAQLAAG